jgi:coenzyme F420 hydrogenase subunit beta
LTIVRTDLGRAIMQKLVEEHVVETRPGDDDPGAIALLHRLAKKSRERWPAWAAPDARVGLPEKKKAATG